ncbi:hypothetical protein [Acrocarpospora sp. B8E8]|uniref:hypothetical protein n=1 Tax=Acrocarpospora sp. B8E8 TaxID=3153572 RepID=UPI00325D0354
MSMLLTAAASLITLACAALVVYTLLRYWITHRRVSGELHTHMALHSKTCCNPNKRPSDRESTR